MILSCVLDRLLVTYTQPKTSTFRDKKYFISKLTSSVNTQELTSHNFFQYLTQQREYRDGPIIRGKKFRIFFWNGLYWGSLPKVSKYFIIGRHFKHLS